MYINVLTRLGRLTLTCKHFIVFMLNNIRNLIIFMLCGYGDRLYLFLSTYCQFAIKTFFTVKKKFGWDQLYTFKCRGFWMTLTLKIVFLGFLTSPGSHNKPVTCLQLVFLAALQLKHWICQEGDCMLDLRRSLYSLPWVCLDVSLPPAVSLHISEERWAKYCVSFTRPTTRAPPASIRQGHSSANKHLW